MIFFHALLYLQDISFYFAIKCVHRLALREKVRMRVYKSNPYIIIPLTPTLSREERGLLRQPPKDVGVKAKAADASKNPASTAFIISCALINYSFSGISGVLDAMSISINRLI